MRARWLIVLLALLVSVRSVSAQTTDPIAQARALDKAGRRADAIQVLRDRLAASPADDDTREVLGLFLSWEGKYDEARTLLQLVLDHRPTDSDAVSGLMNVELWSGPLRAARLMADRGAALKPGDERFTLGRERVLNAAAAAKPWTFGAAYSRDTFSDGRDPWQESHVSLKRYTAPATVIASVAQARRFGLKDTQYQLEVYPKFRPGTYAYVFVGVAQDKVLYPHIRTGADLNQSIGAGFELSAGFRRLEFATVTNIYVGSISKYAGDWLLTGRMYYVPDRTGQSSKSYHGSLRHYFGSTGTSYIGARYSRGFSREEVVSINDFEVLSSNTVAADADIELGRVWRLSLQGATSRQQRVSNVSLRQTTVSASLAVRF